VDGVDNNFMMNETHPACRPPWTLSREFRVLDNTSAEFGRSSGSNVNLVIKSGSPQPARQAYEYLRNDKLDANDFFANRNSTGKVPYRQNQYGVAVGGRGHSKIYHGRDKTFLGFSLGRISGAPGANHPQQLPDPGPA